MIRKNFAWACVSIIAGVVISLAISWLTIWVYVRSEHVASQYRSPFSKFAFGYGPEFNRWAVDIEEYSFGVSTGASTPSPQENCNNTITENKKVIKFLKFFIISI